MEGKKWIIHHRNRLARGQTELSLFQGVVQTGLILWLFLRDLMTIPRGWVFFFFPVCLCGVLIAQYVVGYLMDRYKMIDAIQNWDAERNPYLVDIKKGMEKDSR